MLGALTGGRDRNIFSAVSCIGWLSASPEKNNSHWIILLVSERSQLNGRHVSLDFPLPQGYEGVDWLCAMASMALLT